MFYLAGLVAVLAATALPSTRAARIPGLLLLALTMLAERIAVTSDSPFLQVSRFVLELIDRDTYLLSCSIPTASFPRLDHQSVVFLALFCFT